MHTKNAQKDLSGQTDEVLFDDWRGLFNMYRQHGRLETVDRDQFKAISKELRKRGFFERVPSQT